MNESTFIPWCYALCYFLFVQVEKVVPIEPVLNNDRIDLKVEVEVVIEGDNVYSSDIKNMLTGSISKINVFVADTFYADDDLQLNGVDELIIFTNKWINEQPVTFDLSGSDGASQPALFNGTAGNPGNNGRNGGNFVAVANEIINGDFLTVKSNGGNGADGQDGGASDDIFVLLNVEDDSYPSGWFSSGGDLLDYYKKYFDNRGYESEISEIDDYTSLYAVFVQHKKASFNIRLHPKKCCGTTGIGGVGGFGGRSGHFIFKHIGSNNNTESTPKFVGNDGLTGNVGKDGKACENLALDVRIDAELQRALFIVVPLHYTLSSHFTVLNHTNSSKCTPVYVSSNETTVSSNEPSEIVTISSVILPYKKFLLENMKNSTLTTMIQETYKLVDENRDINDQNSLRGLVLEALELERNYVELKMSMNVIPLYRRLFRRIKALKLKALKDNAQAKQCLRSILRNKLTDLRLENASQLLIMNLSDIDRITNIIENGNDVVPMIYDAELENNLNQLRFLANGNQILARYHRVIEQFRISYFPFAGDYLQNYDLPTSTTSYINLDDIVTATISRLNMLRDSIGSLRSTAKFWNINDFDGSDPQYNFYIWKSEDFREEIRSLFEGKVIKLSANIKQAKKQFNALKFNTIDLVFRSSDPTVNDQLKDVLKSFNVRLKHSGQSLIRCNDNFYELITDPISLMISFEKDQHLEPQTQSGNYRMLRYNDPMLSPYTLWEIQLLEEKPPTQNISVLVQFAELDINIELHGTGRFIEENAPICEKRKLGNFYTSIGI